MIILETIYLSIPLFKYNYKNKKQERVIVITNLNLYNFKVPDVFNNFISKLFSSAIMRRKIPLQKILAITISKIGFEFVIHVPDEYDYRYSSLEKFCFFFIKKFTLYLFIEEI